MSFRGTHTFRRKQSPFKAEQDKGANEVTAPCLYLSLIPLPFCQLSSSDLDTVLKVLLFLDNTALVKIDTVIIQQARNTRQGRVLGRGLGIQA